MVDEAFLKAWPKHVFPAAILYIFFSFPNNDTNWWSSVPIPRSIWRRVIFHSTTTAGSVVMYPALLMIFSNVSLSPCGCRCGDFRVHFRQKALGFINFFLFSCLKIYELVFLLIYFPVFIMLPQFSITRF